MNNDEKILALLTALTEKVDSMDGRLDRLETTQAQQGEQLTELKMDVDKRFDGIEKRLDELDARSLKSAVLLETEVARDTHIALEGHSELKRKMDTLATKEQAQKIAADVEVIKDVVKHHRIEINELKKAQ